MRFTPVVEEWRDIPSLPPYEASSLGQLRLKSFTGKMPRGGQRVYGTGTPTCGQPAHRDGRFLIVYRGKCYKVHRLICEAFHGPSPFPRAVVMHLDENWRNNQASNLKWGTQKENLSAPQFVEYRHGRGPAAKYLHGEMP